MSIADELREWAKTLTHWWYDPVKDEYTYTTGIMPPSIDAIRLDSNITAIADRIDAEHGWVKLPIDADGVPIRVGDVLTDGEYTFTVFELSTFGDGSWSIRNENGNAWAACDVTHHHEPTVEDVLREFTDAILEWAGKSGSVAEVGTWSEVAAEYAAKLRLAGDE